MHEDAVQAPSPGPAPAADTLKVPKDFETIQAAIDAAAAGDTIQIAKGRYTERLVVPAGLDGTMICVLKGSVYTVPPK